MGNEWRGQPNTGPVTYVVLLGGFALMLAVSKPFVDQMRASAREAECPTNLEFIATILAETPAAPRSCGPWPSTPPSAAAVSWAEAPACWDALRFDRDLALWGQYEVRPEGDSWVATCRLDLDGDGEAAVYEASEHRTAHLREGTQD